MLPPSAKFRLVLAFVLICFGSDVSFADARLQVGVTTVDITPGENYPMSGYYSERFSTGVKDPLLAKAIVLKQGDVSAAIVVCDLIAIASDLTKAVRNGVHERTGIPLDNIMLSGTHTHTGPDYGKELFALSTGRPIPQGSKPRSPYVARLIDAIVTAVADAHQSGQPMSITAGTTIQTTPVSFNRRFLLKDGKVKTWGSLKDPMVVHAEGPIDPEIGMVAFYNSNQKPVAVFSSFALHLDTVGGTEYSADYPFFIDRTVKDILGPQVVSVFGNGCCGNINHVNPDGSERLKTDFIGSSLGKTIGGAVPKLTPLESPRLQARRAVVRVPLQSSTPEQLEASKKLIREIHAGKKAEFFANVDAYKRLILENLRTKVDQDEWMSMMSWGLCSSLANSGDTLPLDVQVITLGRDVAIVALPGEVFVELGLAIKNASPFKTTLVVELSNNVESIYIPTRYAYIGGSYETTNTTLQPGGGELLAEAAIRLLAESAAALDK